METARRLATLLRSRFGVRRVVLFGSLARGEFGRGSDIDLAVEGLAADRLFRAGADLDEMAHGIRVDLVPVESATRSLRDRLENEGIVLP